MSNQMSPNQRIKAFLDRLTYIKGEAHQAVHPTLIRDRIVEVINALEFLFAGQITNVQPNVVPGVPAGMLDDPSKTKVEFTSGPGAVMQAQQVAEAARQAHAAAYGLPAPGVPPLPPGFSPQGYTGQAPPASNELPWGNPAPPMGPPPGTPINTTDVKLIPGPPPGVSTGIGGGGGQQTVVYIKDGVEVDVNGNPIGGNRPSAATFSHMAPETPQPQADYRIPGGDYGGRQNVEFSGGPQNPASVPAGAPVTNQPAQLTRTVPTLPTEAGGPVAPIPGGRQSYAYGNGGNGGEVSGNGFAGLFPGLEPQEPPPGAPRSLEEARAKLPIPIAD